MTSPRPDSPLVAAIVPTCDRAGLLTLALQSIADQEYAPIEVIVIDNASVDDTPSVIERFGRVFDERSIALKYRRLDRNLGPGAARNRAVEMAEGSVLAFLDSDDIWHRRFLKATVPLLRARPSCAVAFSGAVRVDQHADTLGPLDHSLPAKPEEGVLEKPFELLVQHMPFRTSCTLLRTAAFHEAGGFDETLLTSEDWDLWWRLAKRFDFAYTLEPLMEYRDHPGNTSKTQRDGPVHSLRFHLRHVGDVRDPAGRSVEIVRIRKRQVELQEYLLTEGLGRDAHRDLLENEFTPATLRFRAGAAALRAPAPVGRLYIRALRLAKAVKRRALRAFSPR